MTQVDIPKFREEIFSIINEHRNVLTDLDLVENNPVITFKGVHYSCEVKLAEDWVGYDLEVITIDGMAGCGLQEDTDNYSLRGKGNDAITIKLYEELKHTVECILTGNVLFSSHPTHSYTAIKNQDNSYHVSHWERKRFLGLHYSSGMSKTLSQDEVDELKLTVLT